MNDSQAAPEAAPEAAATASVSSDRGRALGQRAVGQEGAVWGEEGGRGDEGEREAVVVVVGAGCFRDSAALITTSLEFFGGPTLTPLA
ncbi:hypothetical protein MTO96_012645 [Rhipicephalus appendiculatus]